MRSTCGSILELNNVMILNAMSVADQEPMKKSRKPRELKTQVYEKLEHVLRKLPGANLNSGI